MDYCMNSAGATNPCVREYEIETSADIGRGTVVTLSGGKAKKASEGDVILGILAEDYKVEKDELDHRAGKGYVKVIVSPGMICTVKAPEFEVETAGEETVVNVSGMVMPSAANAFVGGFVKLVAKSQISENSDSVGTLRRITASSGTKLTVEKGGVAGIGDRYAVIPPAGFTYLALSGDSKSVIFAASESKGEKVVVTSPEKGTYELGFSGTFFN